MTSDCNSCDDLRAVACRAARRRPASPGGPTSRASRAPGFEGSGVGDYTKHYNPFAYSEQIGEGAIARRHVVGFGALRRDLRRGTLPRFSWIAPDLLHDGHNASVRASDRFAARLVPRIVRALGPARRPVRHLGRGPGRDRAARAAGWP